jgi:hypothetical protein
VICDYLVFPQYEQVGQRYDIQVLPQIRDRQARVQYIQDNGIPYTAFQNRTLVSISRQKEVKLVYFNQGTGNILIKATGLREAYRISRAFQTYLTIFCEVTPNEDRLGDYLIELSQIPQFSWTDEDLAKAMTSSQNFEPVSEILPLYTGQYLFAHYLSDAAKYVPIIYHDIHISDSTAHLDQSYALFYGLMSGSYYHYHYARDRVVQSQDELLKDYLEHKPKYELAFLAAFKAIELLIGNGNINKSRLKSVFQSNPYSLIKHDNVWERFHEIFAQKPQYCSFEELLEHFLDMRNVVAAHGNRKPPKHFLITPDNLFEIQRFASHLIHQAIESHLLQANPPNQTI